MIHPHHPLKKAWDVFIFGLILFTAVETPLRLVFDYPIGPRLWFMDMLVMFSFALDIILNFNTKLVIGGKLVANRGVVARRYLKGWFIIDLVATIPFDLLLGGTLGTSARAVRVLRLLRLTRLFRLLRLARLASALHEMHLGALLNPSILRLGFFAFWICLSAHWVTAGWLALSHIPHDQPVMDVYLRALYWCVTTLTTVGYGDITPKNNPQYIYTMVVMMLGVGVYGYVIGNVASLLSNLDTMRAQFEEKREGLLNFMKSKNVPRSLQKRVRDYYDYLWEKRRGTDEAMMLEDLPRPLRTEISLFLHRELIQKVPIFQGSSELMLNDIVLQRRPAVFTPGDYIVRRGEPANEMFFISNGTVNVIGDDPDVIYATVTEGGFFGEMALLRQEPRTASVRAHDYCELYVLSKENFDVVLNRYPEFARVIRREAKQRQKRRNQRNSERGET